MSIYAMQGTRPPMFIGAGRAAWRVSAPSDITHGFQINSTNVGVNNYFDASLGRNVLNSDLTVHNSQVFLSDITTAGSTLTKHWFKGGFIADINNVTFVACRSDSEITNSWSGVGHPLTMSWCSVDVVTPDPAGLGAIGYGQYNLTRCSITGTMDGLKANGACVITECYIRTKTNAPDDHNDGVQSTASDSGNIVQRCNIDCNPVNGWNPETGGPNAALFAADSSIGLMEWYDNFCAGGGYTVKCHEDCTYNVQGNWVLSGSYQFGPASRAVIPQSNLTWGTVRQNLVVNSSGVRLSVIDVP